MKEIPLSRGLSAAVDDDDYPILARYAWSATTTKDGRAYAMRTERVGTATYKIGMHRQILGAPAGADVDHVDGNGLNNQRHNLRLATRSQNAQNQHRAWGASDLRGVSWRSREGKWQATIAVERERVMLGRFDTQEQAAHAYSVAAILLHGDFASPPVPGPYGPLPASVFERIARLIRRRDGLEPNGRPAQYIT